MNPKLPLCLALALIGMASDSLDIALAGEPATPVATNPAPTIAKVTLYRTTGGPVQLDATREVLDATNGEDIVAFADPATGQAWMGLSPFEGTNPHIYLETGSIIVCGRLLWGAAALGMSRRDTNGVASGTSAYVEIRWDGSFVDRIKPGDSLKTEMEEFKKQFYSLHTKMYGISFLHQRGETLLGSNLQLVENGVDPWMFVGEGSGEVSEIKIESVDVHDGKVRLDLKSSKGKASLWIDPKTWQLVKPSPDDKP